MSQFNVGKATIDLVGQNEDLQKKLAQATAELERFKAKGKAAGAGVDDTFKQSASTFTAFRGRIVGLVGIFGSIALAANRTKVAVVDAFKSGTAVAKEFVATLNTVDPEAIKRSVEAQVSTLEGVLGRQLGDNPNGALGPIEGFIERLLNRVNFGSVEKIKEQIEVLRRSSEAAAQQIRAKEQAEAKSRIESERKALRSLQNEKLEGIDAVNAKEQTRIADLEERQRLLSGKRADREVSAIIDQEKAQVRLNAAIERANDLLEEQNRLRERFRFQDIGIPSGGRGGEIAITELLLRTGGR